MSLCHLCRQPPCLMQVLGFFQLVSLQTPSGNEQSNIFLQIVTPVLFPIGNGRTSRNPRQVVAASVESSSTSVQPEKHTRTCCVCCVLWIHLCFAVELLRVQAWVVVHMHTLVHCGCFNPPVRRYPPPRAPSHHTLVSLLLKLFLTFNAIYLLTNLFSHWLF